MIKSKQKNLKLAFLFTFLAVIAGLAIIPYELAMGDTFRKSSVPLTTIMAAQTLQLAIMTFITSYVGLTLANKVGLDTQIIRAWVYHKKTPPISKRGFIQAVVFGAVGAGLILTMEQLIFKPFIPQISMTAGRLAWWKGLLAVLYGGIYEETLVRLFIMSLLVWGLSKLFSRGKEQPQSFVYWMGIIGAALLFGLGHLPATMAVFGTLTPLIVVRALLLNGLLGVAFGYLYWKKGLEYAMLSHAIGDIVLHVIAAI